MSANDLLYWMSARGQGSWQQFRAAVEELHLVGGEDDVRSDDEEAFGETFPLYMTLRLNLQRLGHAEFFGAAGEAEWRITPPTLALARTGTSFLGVLVGARSLKLMERVRTAINGHALETLGFPASPDRITIVADDLSSFRLFTERAHLFLQTDAPTSILASVPTIDHPAMLRAVKLPFGADWRVERFSASKLRWKSATRDEAKNSHFGLFRFSYRHTRLVCLCKLGKSFQVPGAVGKYLVLRARKARHVFSYNPSCGGSLSVPVALRPPFLIERALILCSGKLPTEAVSEDKKLHLRYSEIPEETAAFACSLLRQEL
jgi:hypothetical protein